MSHPEHVPQNIDLSMTHGASGSFIHLLEQGNVWGIVCDRCTYAFRVVFAIEPANAFVHVVRQNPKVQFSPG